MARPAPSVDRTIQLLNFLAENPQRQFTLSDIARRLDFNKATCHAMLSELVEGGVLVRHPAHKTYGLGPTLVSWGVASAHDAYHALEFAETEMTALRDTLDATCVAVGQVGFDIVVLGRRDTERPVPSYVPVGHRVPAVPPFALEFLAWATDEEVDEWIGRLGVPLDSPDAQEHRASLREMRAKGFRVSFVSSSSLGELLAELKDDERSGQFRQAVDELLHMLQKRGWGAQGLDSYVDAIVAPVFDHKGRPVLALTLGGFARQVRADEVDGYVGQLLAATKRITKALGGHVPAGAG